MKLILRGHHLLCLKGFQGYGYDKEFTENMTIINEKRKHDDVIVNLTDCPDDICASCPNLKDDLCENESQNNNIIGMDQEVLKHFDLSKDYDSVELFEMVDDIFNSKKSVSKICFNCMWHEKCLFYQKLSNDR